MTSSRELVVHARSSSFSYECRACTRCCYGKRIAVNPYELARLSRNLGITTTELIDRYTSDGGTALATRADAACVFLGSDGCTVHADRPLVCRLYPLGRIVQPDGAEQFVENEPHPEAEGRYGRDGTVGAYLESQDVAPFIVAADRYYAVFAVLTRSAPSDDGDLRSHPTDDRAPRDVEARMFIDADLAVAAHAPRGDAPPIDADGLIRQHLALIQRWAGELAQR